jgi:peptidyl-prolyl cis-trans isomerase A (cyclophilin A)
MRQSLAVLVALLAVACTDKPAQPPPPSPLPQQALPRELNPQDVISMSNIPQGPGDLYAVFQTSRGNIVVKLFEKDAPKTVANFVGLAEGKQEWIDPRTGQKSKARLYDGTGFHRVIPQFMIQGGDPEGTGMGGPGYKFADETKGSKHGFQQKGKLAMANSGPNTNGSQFFITVGNTDWLTGKHTIFGEVVEGYDVVEKISKAARNRQDRPNKDVVVKSVKIER